MSGESIKFLLRRSYLSSIRKSVGSKMFQTVWAEVDGKEQDVTRGGLLSCAVFVSSLLKMFDLVGESHATVDGTVADMERSGWFEIEEPREGAVLVWEEREFEDGLHKHIGFYTAEDKAISSRPETRTPVAHHYLYEEDDPRAVTGVFWHDRLDE